jgi:serine protease
MQPLDVLRAIAAVSGPRDTLLKVGIVRFTLELRDGDDPSSFEAHLQALLGGQFTLMPLGARLPAFQVLQFPGVRRTIAPDQLFAMADALVEELGLRSCTPDIGSRLYAEPDARLLRDFAPESAILDTFCWSDVAAPTDKHWSVKTVRAPEAWVVSRKRGKGIIVAQPDTGVATHPEIDANALRLDLATDIIGGDTNPTDPLDPNATNPGHGTATGSVVISREGGQMIGTAPEASLVPIRCIEDVKIFDGTPVAAAILHAVAIKAHVITMSLGGIPSVSMSAAIAEAIRDGVIVVAAAGNCVGIVVFPAAYSYVIAVAGVDSNDRPWKGSSAGSAVTISAPAENVYVARRTPADKGVPVVSGGQGTSFAVATVAGIAALWLSHFSRDAVLAEAVRRRTSVQELFRSALAATARRPRRWNSHRYGAGIADAEALLKLELAEIPVDSGMIETASLYVAGTRPAEAEVAGVFAAAARGAMEGEFDWHRYGAEAAYLAADRFRRDGSAAISVETAGRPIASRGLAAKAPAMLRQVLGSSAPFLGSPIPAPGLHRDTATILGRDTSAGIESTAASRSNLEGAGLNALMTLAEKRIAAMAIEAELFPESSAAQRKVLNEGERVVTEMLRNGEASLNRDDQITLEALVRLKGRPAFKVTDSAIVMDEAKLTDWGGTFVLAEPWIKPLVEAVGRIDIENEHVGTGFVVGDGLVMTNRHVLEAIASRISGPNGVETWILRDQATINFDDRGRGFRLRFAVRSVVATGSDEIARRVDFGHLDMAVLEVATEAETVDGGTRAKLPKALPMLCDKAEGESVQDVLVVGYPARPDLDAFIDPVTKEHSVEVQRRLAAIFGLDFSRKYLSPGRIVNTVGVLPNDTRKWILSHDATTLGGNSGSVVVALTDGLPALALHFAGRPLTANYCHGLGAVKAAGGLPAAVFERLICR